jgi:DNA polymerase-3 subunit chi
VAEITFYILPTASTQERLLFACKLVEKIYRSEGQPCYVLTDSLAQSQRFDDLLWTFRAGSFIPHQLYSADSADLSPYQKVLIGFEPAPQGWHKLVLNLSSQIVTQAERVLEILDNSEQTKAAGRLRYRHYQQAGDNITTHKM